MGQDVEFPEFFASQYAALCRLGYWLTGDRVEAEELAQEALVRAYWRWPIVRRLDRPLDYTRKVLAALLRRLAVPLRRRGALPGRAALPRAGGDRLGGHRRAGEGERGDPAPRRRHQAVGAGIMTEGTTNPAAADLILTFGANQAMCHVRASVTVELLEGGRLAAVEGNGATATIDGDLPEGDGESPSFTRAWLWRNWCGSGNVSLRIGGPGGVVIPAKSLARPGCADPSKASTLVAITLPVRPGP